MSLRNSVEAQWYGRATWLLALAPLSSLMSVIVPIRRRRMQAKAQRLGIPVVVVGNISVGGTGKTPLIGALCQQLQKEGYSPGIISRGYGADIETSTLLPHNANPECFGDEPVMLARETGCPVVVGRKRNESIQLLKDRLQCDVILSDDGLQHYEMHRDIEIAVIDAQKGFGNGWLLPVGPLREPPERLRSVDWIVANGKTQDILKLDTVGEWAGEKLYGMDLIETSWVNVKTGLRLSLEELDIDGAVAIAGIGNPQRFFASLASLGFTGPTQAFADHHPYQAEDIAFAGNRTVLMTSKDAVKCHAFAQEHWWALQIDAMLPSVFYKQLVSRLKHSK